MQNKWQKYRTAAVRYFCVHLFQGALILPHRAAYVFFENVVKIFVLTNAALPADLGDGQFSLPDEFQSVLNAAAVEVVNDRCAKLFLKLLVDVSFRVVELFLKVSKCYLALVILFLLGYDAQHQRVSDLIFA